MKRLAPVIILALCFLVTSTLHAQPNPGFGQNFGSVKRLYPEPNRTYFSLSGGATSMNPTNGYYYVPKTHPNYDAMIDLLYLAAEKRWTLKVRTQPALDANGHAEVIYFVVDF